MVIHMEKYTNIVKIEKVKKCLEQGDVLTALSIGKTINRKKLKNMSDLSVLAEAYFQNKQYEEAKEIFVFIYEKSKSRRILAQLVHLSIRLNDGEAAKQYLEEFKKIAPKDCYCHIFQYNIDKMLGMDIQVQIEDLERLKKQEYMENWAYELAKLYHKAGMKEKCVEECGNLILWFGNGVYVEKAKALRAYYQGELDLKEFSGKSQEKKEEDIASQIRAILREQEEERAAKRSKKLEAKEDSDAEEEYSNEGYWNENLHDTEEAFTGEDSQNKEDELVETVNQSPEEETSGEVIQGLEEPSGNIIQNQEEEPYAEVIQSFEEGCSGEVTQSFEQGSSVEATQNLESCSENVLQEENEDYESATQKMETELDSQNEEIAGALSIVELTSEESVTEISNETLQVLENQNISLNSIFGAYLYLEATKKQIYRSVERIVNQKEKHVNMIITGGEKTGKTYLAKCISRLMHQLGIVRSSKIAIINAEKLRGIDLRKKADQLNDCMLIIENAGALSKESVFQLFALDRSNSAYAAIVLEGSLENINQLLREYSELSGVFNNRIHLNKYNVEDYLNFALIYAREREYEIEVDAYELLRNEISKEMKENGEYKLEQVFRKMHDILQNAEKRSTTELLRMTQTGKYSNYDLMVIRKQDIES